MSCPAIPFDTLRHFERMIKVGFTKEQAKEQTEAIEELALRINNDIATKNDIKELRKELKDDILELKKDIKADMKILGAMIILGVTALGLLIKL